MPMNPTPYKAYLAAIIDTQSGHVIEVRIFSEERPTMVAGKAYGFMASTSGKTFEEAKRKMEEQVKKFPYLQWTRLYFRDPSVWK